MKRRPRIYYTEAQKALMWDRWKAGDTLHEIGKLFDCALFQQVSYSRRCCLFQ